MKPKPLVVLKNFTVPVCAIGGGSFSRCSLGRPARVAAVRRPGGLGGHAFITRATAPAKVGLSEIHSVGERVVKASSLRDSKCPNTKSIARKCERFNKR